MDELDMAQDAIDGEVTSRIAAARKQESIPATGLCLNCGEALKEGLRWCDADCRDDWTRARRTAATTGRGRAGLPRSIGPRPVTRARPPSLAALSIPMRRN